MQSADNLKVTAYARRLATEIYRATTQLPAEERFGLSLQMRRAAVSIGSNIAEGCGRDGNRELIRFLQIALGSASELEFQAELSIALGFLPTDTTGHLLSEISRVKRMLARLIKALRARSARPSAER